MDRLVETLTEFGALYAPHLFAAVVIVVVLIIAESAIRKRRKQRLIHDTPTCSAAGVFIGLVELEGSAECEKPLTSRLSEVACVYYHSHIQERWRRRETETYRDRNGNSRTRTRTRTGWDTVFNERAHTPFYLRDESGIVRIRPERAEITAASVLNHTCGPDEAMYFNKGPQGSVPGSTHRRRFIEQAIVLHQPLYIIGQSRLREDVVAAEVATDEDAPLFVISAAGQQSVARRYRLGFYILFAVGLICASIAPWLAAQVFDERLLYTPTWSVVAAGAYLSAWTLRWSIMIFNSLRHLHYRTDQAWSNVEIELKRRADLIPQLIALTKGLADHTQRLQTILAQLRGRAAHYNQQEAQAVSAELKVVVEDYPELSTNAQFMALTRALTVSENRIAMAKSYYNDMVAAHNERLQRIPDRFFRLLAGLRKRSYFQAQGFERVVPDVSLAD